jgi:hypothetical protein
MGSHAYLIQDSDQYIKMIVEFVDLNLLNLPQSVKIDDQIGLSDRNKVAIF